MKKSLITMLVALVLVAAVGVGATLAYLTDSTDVKINTFKVGDVDIDLTETADANGTAATVTATEDGFKFENLQPGDVVGKIPVVTVASDSNDCYVYVKVTGDNDTLKTNMSSDWVKVADNIFRYKSGDDAVCTKNQALTVFTTVTVSTGVEEQPEGGFDPITVKACAVQAANIAIADADAQAIGIFNNNN
ncbi:SipW-cognate class signal peptide [Lachnospiraceae bacterium G11]|nr:SipW-cognate class signal peptide [Lachnospiraceae bacterium G11]